MRRYTPTIHVPITRPPRRLGFWGGAIFNMFGKSLLVGSLASCFECLYYTVEPDKTPTFSSDFLASFNDLTKPRTGWPSVAHMRRGASAIWVRSRSPPNGLLSDKGLRPFR